MLHYCFYLGRLTGWVVDHFSCVEVADYGEAAFTHCEIVSLCYVVCTFLVTTLEREFSGENGDFRTGVDAEHLLEAHFWRVISSGGLALRYEGQEVIATECLIAFGTGMYVVLGRIGWGIAADTFGCDHAGS